jgi:phage repressor protein C with HTH and peptisase S24 domain
MDQPKDLDAPEARLTWARRRRYPEAATFARVVGMKEVTYRSYESGQNGFAKHASGFAAKLGVPTDWLLNGGPLSDEMLAPIALTDESAADQLDAVLLPEVEVSYSMGGGSINDDFPIIQMVPFSRAWLETLTRSPARMLMVARGDGDSMTPTIMDRDIVIIDRSDRRFNSQDRIWAVCYGEFGMIKRVRALPGGQFQINSDNPAVTPIVATEDELTFIGRVVGVIRRI